MPQESSTEPREDRGLYSPNLGQQGQSFSGEPTVTQADYNSIGVHGINDKQEDRILGMSGKDTTFADTSRTEETRRARAGLPSTSNAQPSYIPSNLGYKVSQGEEDLLRRASLEQAGLRDDSQAYNALLEGEDSIDEASGHFAIPEAEGQPQPSQGMVRSALGEGQNGSNLKPGESEVTARLVVEDPSLQSNQVGEFNGYEPGLRQRTPLVTAPTSEHEGTQNTQATLSELEFLRKQPGQTPDVIDYQNRLAPDAEEVGAGNLSKESTSYGRAENPANQRAGRPGIRERMKNSRILHPFKVNEGDGMIKKGVKKKAAKMVEHAAIEAVAEKAALMAAPEFAPFIMAAAWAAKHRHGIVKFLRFLRWLLIILFIVVLYLLVAAFLPRPDQQGNQGEAIGAGGSANVSTVSTLDGLTIPFPDTKLGHERHFSPSVITGTPYNGPDSAPTNDGTENSAAFGSMTPEEERWYFTEPWAYPNDKSSGCVGRSSKWKGKKLVVTSVETHKSVVVSVQECGPNYTGVTQRDGIGAGAPPEVFHALGITNLGKAYDKSGVNADGTPRTNNNRISVAFAADQNIALGPVASSDIATGGSIPADKGLCSFCTQMPLPADSPNINHNYGVPKVLILHYLSTSGSSDMTPQQAFSFFKGTMEQSGNGQKYVQFVVGKDGTIYQFLPETKQVAGAQNYNVAKGGVTISIENEGDFENSKPGHNFTSAQAAANAKLVKYLMEKYSIGPTDVISHMIADCRAIQAGTASAFHRTDPGIPFMHAVLGKLGINNSAEESTCATLKKRVGTK